MSTATLKRPKPLKETIGPHEAAKLIGCGYSTLLRLIDAQRITATRPLGRGRGKPILLERGEVERFAKAYRIVTGPLGGVSP